MSFYTRALSVMMVSFVLTAVASAEVPLLSKASLEKAPEIVVGEVAKIYQRDPTGAGFRRVDYLAEVNVSTVQKSVQKSVQKGSKVQAGDVIYVHYWNQIGERPERWVGTRGHHSECLKEGATVRLYLRLDERGRREILLPNGAEPIK